MLRTQPLLQSTRTADTIDWFLRVCVDVLKAYLVASGKRLYYVSVVTHYLVKTAGLRTDWRILRTLF